MSRLVPTVLACVAAAAALALPSPAVAVHGGDGLQWSDTPPNMPKGAKMAVLKGDPSKPGPFVLRLSTPAGYKVAPHSHSQEENLTVISGTFQVGMGDKVNTKELKSMGPGAFGSIPAGANHYAMSKTASVVQLHGEGPFDIKYANPSDDPSQK